MNNANDEVFYNNKYEVLSMMAAMPKLSNAVTHYASHCLRANVQFSDILIQHHLLQTRFIQIGHGICSSPRKEKHSKISTGKYVVPHK